MITFVLTILFIIVVLGVICFFKSSKSLDGESFDNRDTDEIPQTKISLANSPGNVVEGDIVLALLTELGSSPVNRYAILWNGIAGNTYEYIISQDGNEVAKDSITSKTNVFKVRGLPLKLGQIYDVQVGITKVRIPFSPPQIVGVNRTPDLNITTDVVPTNIEIIVNGVKIPLEDCQIRIEPPGVICKIDETDKPIVVVYNGPNAVNILS